MKIFTKKILSLFLACSCIFSTTACGGEDKTAVLDSSNPSVPCEHSYTSEVTKEATCNEAGVRTYTCRNCDDSYTEELAKLTHVYTSEVTKKATCNEVGVRTYTCRNCNDSYTEELAKLTHVYTSEVTKEATCNEAGVRTYTCRNCDDSYTEEIAKLTHSYTSSITKEATCDEAGVRTYTCRNCDDSYTEEIAKLTHSYTSSITKEATCDEAGVRTYTCSDCGDFYTEDIAKNENHSLTRNGTCYRCGFNSTIKLNMSEDEKSNASKIKSRATTSKVLTDNTGNYIVKFGLFSIHMDTSSSLAVPTLIDITITNSNGLSVYSKTKEVKATDYQIEDGILVAIVKINVNELTAKNEKLTKLYFSVYNPGYFYFSESEFSVPATIIMPNLPVTIHRYSWGELLTSVKVTEITCSLNLGSYSDLYFTGEKTYDQEGDSYSRGCSIGYKLYDMEGYLVGSGTYTTDSLAVGEKFKNGREYAFFQLLEAGRIYRLEILNVG